MLNENDENKIEIWKKAWKQFIRIDKNRCNLYESPMNSLPSTDKRIRQFIHWIVEVPWSMSTLCCSSEKMRKICQMHMLVKLLYFRAQTFLNTSRPQNTLPKHLNAIGACEFTITIGTSFCISIGNRYQSSSSTASQTSKYAILILSLNSHGMNVSEDDHPSCTTEITSKMVLLSLWK